MNEGKSSILPWIDASNTLISSCSLFQRAGKSFVRSSRPSEHTMKRSRCPWKGRYWSTGTHIKRKRPRVFYGPGSRRRTKMSEAVKTCLVFPTDRAFSTSNAKSVGAFMSKNSNSSPEPIIWKPSTVLIRSNMLRFLDFGCSCQFLRSHSYVSVLCSTCITNYLPLAICNCIIVSKLYRTRTALRPRTLAQSIYSCSQILPISQNISHFRTGSILSGISRLRHKPLFCLSRADAGFCNV